MSTQSSFSASLIDWTSLGKVAGVSFVFGVAIVVLFSVGIIGVSWMHGHDSPDADAARDRGNSDAGGQGSAVAANQPLGATLAVVCFGLCTAAVVFGLWLLIPQFHR
jgi:1,4-dihydroxy-2-naphthoate octaprenyltransferase